MDTFYWLTAALIVSVSAICGTILIREKMREKAMEAYNFRGEKEYQQIEKERDAWHLAYEQEHGERIASDAMVKVAKMVYGKKNVADMGGKIGGKK